MTFLAAADSLSPRICTLTGRFAFSSTDSIATMVRGKYGVLVVRAILASGMAGAP